MAAVSRRGRARATVLPFPHAPGLGGDALTRLLPSGRALLLGFGLLAGGALAYVGARETSIFSLRTIELTGSPPRVAAHVRRALRPLEGKSLLALHAADIERRLDRLPDVAGVSYDRDFPHTLRLRVTPAHSIAVARRGPESWIVSSDGRVVRTAGPFAAPRLPRVWLPRTADVEVGATLADPNAARALATLTSARSAGFGARMTAVRASDDELTLVLASGLEVRLGSGTALRLKLAVVRRILPLVSEAGYLDVSVPERPVAGAKP